MKLITYSTQSGRHCFVSVKTPLGEMAAHRKRLQTFWKENFNKVIDMSLPGEKCHAVEGFVTARLERWLCEGPSIVRSGPEAGAVVGRLNSKAQPDYAYPEIAGYFLTWLAFMQRIGETRSDHSQLAYGIAEWVSRWVSTDMETRVHLSSPKPDEWRNRALFLFDVAMLMRGLAQATECGLVDSRYVTPALSLLAERVAAMRDHDKVLSCLSLHREPIPERWSTRRGPFMLKALVSILQASKWVDASRELSESVFHTLPVIWPSDVTAVHTDSSHAALYFVEGVLLAQDYGVSIPFGETYCRQIICRVFDNPDAELKFLFGGRNDVSAQWLRASLLIPFAEEVHGLEKIQLDVAVHLAREVTATGALSFGSDDPGSSANTWCAIFTHQALWLFLRKQRGFSARLPTGCLV